MSSADDRGDEARARARARGSAAVLGSVLAVAAACGALVAATPEATPAAALDADGAVYLPLALHGRPRFATPRPSATATGEPTLAPGATASPTAPPSATTPPEDRPIDECADMAPEWVFCDGFERGQEWDGSVKEPPLAAEPGPFGLDGNHVARLRVPEGTGGLGLWKSLPPHDRLYARWYVRWEPGHDLTDRHHGPGGLGADVSWYTGRSGIRPNGDEYFVASLEPSTGTPHVVYSYTYSRGMYMDCADPNGRCWGDLFPCYAGPSYCTRPQHLPTVEQAGVVTGRWTCLEQMIDAGTPVRGAADADGVLDFWIDEVEIGPWDDLWWRTVPTLQVNFLWLYLYHHAEHSVEGLEVDNVVVSTARIGCGR